MKIRTLSLLLLLMVSLGGFAGQKFNAVYGGIKYKFVVKGGNEVSIVGVKGMKRYEIKRCKLPTTIKHGGADYTVTEIGDGAFKEARNIDRLVLPEGLKRIGKRAFTKCIRLKTVEFPVGLEVIDNQAFFGVPLTEVFLPEAIQTIGKEAFCAGSANLVDISRIKHLDVPETCQSIGNHAFSAFKNGVGGWQATTCEVMRLPDFITWENCEKYGLSKATMKQMGRLAPVEEDTKDEAPKAEKKSKKSKKSKAAEEPAEEKEQ